MRDHSSNIVAHTRTGVGQGDPWGGLFFELGYQATLLHLSSYVIDAAAAYNRSNPSQPLPRSGHVGAYEDDTQVMGPPALVFHIAPYIAPILAQHGFYMNVDKNYITGLYTDAPDGQPDDFNIHSDGLVILGVPTGCRTFRQTNARHILLDMAPPTAVLSLLNPRTALHLLIQCYNSSPSYLLRTAPNYSAIALCACIKKHEKPIG